MRVARRRRGRPDDEGFVLLESIMAIALITVLMVALTSLFISAMQSTAHQRATQGASRIATDEIDQARGLGAAAALSGRDKTSVQAQFAKAPAKVQTWLSTSGVQAFSATATNGAGAIRCTTGVTANTCAVLPTTPVLRTVNNTAYSVGYYQQWCHLDSTGGGTPNCSDATVATDSTLRQYLRVVVAIGWTDSTCTGGGCSYITSVMLSVESDPTFYFRNPPPPKPVLSGCATQQNKVGDQVDLAMTGTGGLCALQGGVPPFTWSGSGLPDSLAVIAAGSITGSLTAPATAHGTLTVTDAFLRTSSAPIDWAVTYPPLATVNPSTQLSTVGAQATPVILTATGGSGSYVFTDPGSTLPDGVTVAGNAITGAPSVAGTFPVKLTVTDGAAAMTGTISFTWTVNPPPSVNPPPNTTVGLGGYFSAQAVGASGTPPYTYALQNAPDWMHIDAATGRVTGIAPTEIADYPGIVVLLTDSKGATVQSAPFTWSVYTIPTIVPPGDQTSNLNEAVALQLQTTCPDGPCTFNATNLPTSWLALDAGTGLIKGTAPATQTFVPDITVTITDSSGFSATSQFNWVVGPQQTITSPGDQVWTDGMNLATKSSVGLQITADCSPAGPCAFSLADPAHPLPPGLIMSTTGLITGTPTAPGTWPGIVVRVTDKVGGHTDAQAFTWTINSQPTLDAPGNQRTLRGQLASKQLSFSCNSDPCEFIATGLPAGLSINSAGFISGTASTPGVNTVTVNLTDKTGAVVTRPFTWYVLSISVPDQTLSKSSGNCKNDSQSTVNLATYVTGYSDVGSLTFTVSSTLTGLAISGTQLTITAPCSTGNYAAKVTVTDAGGGVASAGVTSATFTVKVI